MSVKLAPSLLSSDFARLAEQIRIVEDAGADLLHVDVMDAHFVPNLTIGPVVVKAIAKVARIPLDVHLMVTEPARFAAAYAGAAAFLTYHVECPEGGPETAEKIRSLGMRPGICLRPKTPLSSVRDHLPLVDMVLVMSVEPGFAGQKFMPEVLVKTKALRDEGYGGEIEMDGGIDGNTIPLCAAAGASVLVAGSAVFSQPDPAAAVRYLKARAAGGAVS